MSKAKAGVLFSDAAELVDENDCHPSTAAAPSAHDHVRNASTAVCARIAEKVSYCPLSYASRTFG
jgi:hypothetical protein